PVAEADGLRGLHRGVLEHALLALLDEAPDAVALDVLLGLEAELLLDLDLDPQPLAVEAVLVAQLAPEHGVVAQEQVRVGAAPGVMDAHRVVGRDRAVEERPALAALVAAHALLERALAGPQLEHAVLER